MFTKLPKITKKKLTDVKKIAKVFQTSKKDVIFLLIFKKLQKRFNFFKQNVKNIKLIDKMRKMYQFF